MLALAGSLYPIQTAAASGTCNVLWVGPTDLNWNDGLFTVKRSAHSAFAAQNLTDFDLIYVSRWAYSSYQNSPLRVHAGDIEAYVNTGGGLITENDGEGKRADFGWVPNKSVFEWAKARDNDMQLSTIGKSHPAFRGSTDASFTDAIQHNYFSIFSSFSSTGLEEIAYSSKTETSRFTGSTTVKGRTNILAGTYGGGRLIYFGIEPSTSGHSSAHTQALIRQAAGQARHWVFPVVNFPVY